MLCNVLVAWQLALTVLTGLLVLLNKKKNEALIAGVVEAGIEAAKLIPGLGIPIEGIRKYR